VTEGVTFSVVGTLVGTHDVEASGHFFGLITIPVKSNAAARATATAHCFAEASHTNGFSSSSSGPDNFSGM